MGLDAAASVLREALVNIICYASSGSKLQSISGSGVFIDSKGIILTNAHVAQYFLLASRGVSCVIRSGGPAIDKYKAALIYLPYSWVNANADILTKTDPIGTGEYDFALLAVTKSATSSDLPSSLPSIPLAQLPPASGTPVVIASYGAQFLEAGQIQSSLFPTVVFGSVKDVYTFVLNTIDILALGGSAAAQEGSSGGGVADASGTLIGTITTSTVQGATATRSLDAITASYIRSEYARETGSSLDILLAKPVAMAVSDFAPQISALGSILTAQLP
jgi:S1-C subfamily serine protease